MNDTPVAEKPFTAWVKKQNAGLWFGIVFLIYAVIFFRLSFDLSYQSKLGAGPGMYPRWLSGFSIVIALIYIAQSCTLQVFKAGLSFPGRHELANVASVFLSCLVFLFLLDRVGFNVAGSLLLFVMFVPQYRLGQAIALSIGITAVHYVVFKVFFSVPLPDKLLSLIGF